MMKDDLFITPRAAAKSIGVTIETLKVWEKNGKITAIKTAGGHRRYKLSEVKDLSRHGVIVYKVVKNNCVAFYTSPQEDAEEVLLNYDFEELHKWTEGARCPELVLCVSSDDDNYYKVFKYPQDIEVGFNVVQMRWEVKC
jgi:excisionase family DNA binding protein